ncbi:MAG: hypothetical protein WBX20_20390 [Terrimicrobiaceae bacterium]
MKFRQSRRFAVAVIAILAVAWLFASNHCALAAAEPASEHLCCHSDKAPRHPGSSMPCCKALAAPIPNAIVAPEVPWGELQPVWLRAAQVVAPAETPILAVALAIDSGPPRRALSFALLILNRSLLSHAPPHFVA